MIIFKRFARLFSWLGKYAWCFSIYDYLFKLLLHNPPRCIEVHGNMMWLNPNDREILMRKHYTKQYFESGRDLSNYRLKTALMILDPQEGEKILDLGCGTGELSDFISRKTEVVGVDFAKYACVETKRRGKDDRKKSVVMGDATCLPFKSKTFDKVLSADLIEHIKPEQAEDFYKEVYRVLKTKGKFVLHTSPNRILTILADIQRRVAPLVGMKPYPIGYYDRLHINKQSYFSCKSSLVKAGFKCKVWAEGYPETAPLSNIMSFLANSKIFSIFFGNDLWAEGWKER